MSPFLLYEGNEIKLPFRKNMLTSSIYLAILGINNPLPRRE